MRKIVFLFIAAFSALSLFAENVNHASNARAAQVEHTMVITYDLSKTSNVRLLMSTDMATMDCYVLSTKRGVFVDEVRDICYTCMMS